MRSGIYTILFFLSFLPVALLAAWYVIGQQRLDKKKEEGNRRKKKTMEER